MALHELRLQELLQCEPESGLIRMHDQRVVIQSVAALGLLRKELIETFGMNVARRLLMRFGYADGYEDAVSLRGGADGSDTDALFRSGPMVGTHVDPAGARQVPAEPPEGRGGTAHEQGHALAANEGLWPRRWGRQRRLFVS